MLLFTYYLFFRLACMLYGNQQMCNDIHVDNDLNLHILWHFAFKSIIDLRSR